MSWTWRRIAPCDLDEMADDINPQMKSLENSLGKQRPAMMAGYPDAQGAVVSNTTVTVGVTTDETDLKSTFIARGTIGSKGGFRVRAAGTCTGGVAVKQIRLYFGDIEVMQYEIGGGTKDWLIDAEFWNADTTQQQKVVVKAWEDTVMDVMDVTTTSVDTL